jgi:hypothetical protein
MGHGAERAGQRHRLPDRQRRLPGRGGAVDALVEASDADFEKARTILTTEVLPEWAKRAGAEWAQRWTDSVGKTVGVTIE